MTLQPLDLFFKVGFILPITPKFSTRTTILRKFYCILIFTILTIGAIFAIESRNFYQDSFFMKQLFLYSNDIILLSLSFHVIVVYNFRKKQQWIKFLEKLEMAKKMTDLGEETSQNPFYCHVCFAVTHVLFLTVTIYGVTIWTQKEGLVALKRITIRLEEYIDFFYLFLLCQILYLLLLCYRGLNRTLSGYVTRKRKFSGDAARVTSYVVCYLRETVDMFNDLFGWPAFLIIHHTILQLLLYMFVIVTHDVSYEALSFHICTVVFTMFMTTLFLVMCDKVTQEAQKTVSLTYKLRWWWQIGHTQKQELYEFTNLVIQNSPVFKAAGFLVTGKYTIIQILATVGSTLVILLQFNNK